MTPKLICFDLDGVFVELRELHRLAFRDALADVGHRLPEEIEEALEALPTKRKLDILGISDPEERSVIIRAKDRFVDGRLYLFAPPWRLEEFCRNNLGRVALVTNSKWSTAQHYKRHFGERMVFSAEFGPPKPSPFLYQAAMAAAAVHPQDTVIFEDSDVGAAAATDSGARVIRVTDPEDTFLKLKELLSQ